MFSRTTPKIASSKKIAARPNIALFETLEQRQLMSGSTEIAAEYAHTASETDAYGVNVHALLGTPTSPIMNVPGVSARWFRSSTTTGRSTGPPRPAPT